MKLSEVIRKTKLEFQDRASQGQKNIERTGNQQLHGLVNFEDPDLLQRCFKKTKVLAE